MARLRIESIGVRRQARRRTVFAVVVIVACGWASSAASQADAPAPSSPEDIRRLHDYSQCVAHARLRSARALLAMDFREQAYQEAAQRLYRAEPGCWHLLSSGDHLPAYQIRFNSRMFAGRMAEALLRRDLDGGDLAASLRLDPSAPPIQARNEEELMSLCTVRAAPNETAAIFATRPASAEEAAAVRAIARHMAGCLTAGATGEFNRAAIRSMLALAAYRLVQHSRASSGPAAGN